ncbi:MAG: dihydrolipoyl dehydrogenase [Planctomycetota bacterium]
MPDFTHDVLVLGAGPGGYVCAIRCAQLGFNTAVVEKEPALGGTCLRVGCIPSKALLESSHKYEEVAGGLANHGVDVQGVTLDLAKLMQRKEQVVKTLTGGVAGLMKKNKVKVYKGHAAFTGDGKKVAVGDDVMNAQHVVIATGSTPASLPGVDITQDRVDTSTDALSYDQVPKKLAVIGAGYIGLEMGAVWRRLGAEVVVLEYFDRILPGMDAEIAADAKKMFEKQGLSFRLGVKVTGVKPGKSGVTIEVEGADPVKADRALVSVGRKPNTEGLGLDKIGVGLTDRGQVQVDKHYATSVQGVWAIGDVIPGPMLAHKAEEEGVALAEILKTGHGHIDYNAIPGIVYTEPEIASVGKTEEQLKEEGVAYRKGVFPFLANGRARALDHAEGKVKVLAHAETDRVLGVHIIGPSAGDLIAECAVAMSFGASSEDIARACHAHPTLAEAVKEAALAVDGRALHI